VTVTYKENAADFFVEAVGLNTKGKPNLNLNPSCSLNFKLS